MRRWWTIGGAAAVVTIAAEMGAHDVAHATHWWHAMPGFDLVYGLGGCVAIVVVAKALGKWWLQRPADYYDEGPP